MNTPDNQSLATSSPKMYFHSFIYSFKNNPRPQARNCDPQNTVTNKAKCTLKIVYILLDLE